MTPYRQPVFPGDSGLDVYAYRRVLRRRGHQLPAVGNTAGAPFVAAVRAVQKNHKFAVVDGVIGPVTHSILGNGTDGLPCFDLYGAWLYQHAAFRYVNPFAKASVVAGRIDMGVDYHGVGPILAIGDAAVVGNGGKGWPGGNYLLYRLTTGTHAGRYVYVAEAVEPQVKAGQKVKGGDVVALFGPGAQKGFYPGIETGWGSATLNETWAAHTGQTGGAHHANSPAGLAFARFLKSLGAPLAADPGPGPTFPVET